MRPFRPDFGSSREGRWGVSAMAFLGLPIKKNRDLIVIETIPSTKTIDENKIKKALERNVCRDYPQNPFYYR